MLPAFLLLSLIPLAWAQAGGSPAGNQSPNPLDQSGTTVDTNIDPNGVNGSPAGNQAPNPFDQSGTTVDTNIDPNGVHGSPAGDQAPIPVETVDPHTDPNNVQFQDGIDPNNLSPPERPAESTPGDLYVCTDAQFGGECEYFHALTYNCYNLADKFKHKLTSIRPDKNQMCQFYESDNCVGDSDWMRWPGSGNMRGRRFDNKAASWTCSDDNCDGVQGPGGCTKNADGSLKGGDPVGDAAKGWDTTRG